MATTAMFQLCRGNYIPSKRFRLLGASGWWNTHRVVHMKSNPVLNEYGKLCHGEAVFFNFVRGKIISPNISCYVFKHQKHEYIIHHCFHGLSFKMKRRKKLGEICPTCKNTNGFLNMNTLRKGRIWSECACDNKSQDAWKKINILSRNRAFMPASWCCMTVFSNEQIVHTLKQDQEGP